MNTRIIKKTPVPIYQDWLKEHGFSILSPRHRGLYGELAFRKFCQTAGIFALKLSSDLPILDQIPLEKLRKTQQKELKKLVKIPFHWFCQEGKQVFFAEVKMGTSSLSAIQRLALGMLAKNRVFLFQVFEDGEIVAKRLA
ncbi:MAG: hypothetical protein Q7S65_02165 [Nanoarchaeota archaeon]|nr:hypothetical protein [Nanoarchaeota archaeon]